LTYVPSREVTAGPVWWGRKSCRLLLCHCWQLPLLGVTKDAGHPVALISTQLSDLQDLPPLPGYFLQSGSSLAPFQATAVST